MNKITMLAVVPLFTLLAFSARAFPLEISGPATFTLTAVAQDYAGLTSARTNHTSTTTNIITVIKSKATNAPINSAFILDLLENSYNTNFPSGAKLIVRGEFYYTFLVVDRTRTNVLLDASSVLFITNNLRVSSALETLIQTTSRTGTKYSGNSTQTFTEYATLIYNDAALTTKDGTHTDFQLSGILMNMLSTTIKTSRSTESVILRAAGAGTIQGKTNIILKGTVIATLSGVLMI